MMCMRLCPRTEILNYSTSELVESYVSAIPAHDIQAIMMELPPSSQLAQALKVHLRRHPHMTRHNDWREFRSPIKPPIFTNMSKSPAPLRSVFHHHGPPRNMQNMFQVKAC
jgi:hypothetical protein